MYSIKIDDNDFVRLNNPFKQVRDLTAMMTQHKNPNGIVSTMAIMGEGNIIIEGFSDEHEGIGVISGLRFSNSNIRRTVGSRIEDGELTAFDADENNRPLFAFAFLKLSDIDNLISHLKEIREVKEKHDAFVQQKTDAKAYIGLKVKKPSGKPFKSGSKENTVKGVVMHPVLKNILAFTFEEDDSYVECRKCELVLK